MDSESELAIVRRAYGIRTDKRQARAERLIHDHTPTVIAAWQHENIPLRKVFRKLFRRQHVNDEAVLLMLAIAEAEIGAQ